MRNLSTSQGWQLNTESTFPFIRKYFKRNPVLVGKEGEMKLKRKLAAEGILVEIGYKMNWKTGQLAKNYHGSRADWVQLDLYDPARKWVLRLQDWASVSDPRFVRQGGSSGSAYCERIRRWNNLD